MGGRRLIERVRRIYVNQNAWEAWFPKIW